MAIVMKDPAIHDVNGFTGGGKLNVARMWAQLKPLGERKLTADQVIDRLRGKLKKVPGATLYMRASQDIRVGGRGSNSQYDYTLQSDKLNDLYQWAPKLLAKMKTLPEIVDANSDQQNHGLETRVIIDRDTASRLGVTPMAIDTALYSSFGQRQVSTMYTGINQYHVVLELLPEFQKHPESLKAIYVRSTNGKMIPMSDFTSTVTDHSILEVNHQGPFPSTTVSFALAPGVALGEAVKAVSQAGQDIMMPASIHGEFSGTARAFQESLSYSAAADFGRSDYRLHRTWHALRELRPSHHYSVHPAVGGSWGTAGAAALPDRTDRHRADRHYSTDWNCKKECDHDDRLRARRRTARRPAFQRCHLPGVSAALPADHDDDAGCATGRIATGVRLGSRIGTAAAVGHHDCRRITVEPDFGLFTRRRSFISIWQDCRCALGEQGS